MKSLTRLQLASIVAVAASFLLFLASCTTTGPMGPAGTNGIDGINGSNGMNGAAGVNAAANCSQCHSNDSVIKAKVFQYNASKHNWGTAVYAEGVNASCARCHGDQGFQAWVAAGKPDGVNAPSYTLDVAFSINCRTCHTIHTTFTSNDYALRTTSSVTMSANSAYVYNGGRGNLCASCHNPRRMLIATNNNAAVYFTTGSSTANVPNMFTTTNKTLSDSHYGAQTVVVAGSAMGAGFQWTNITDWASLQNGHYNNVSDTCVGCHMRTNYNVVGSDIPANPGHGLYLTNQANGGDYMNNCKVCHSTATTHDYHGAKTSIRALLTAVSNVLVASNIMNADNSLSTTNTTRAVTNFVYMSNIGTTKSVYSNTTTAGLLYTNTSYDIYGYIFTNNFATTNGSSVLTSRWFGIWFNYNLVFKDGSYGVHNYPYAYRLLTGAMLAVTNGY